MRVLLEEMGGVMRLTLDRPPVNALDLPMIKAITEKVQDLPTDKPVILRAEGRAFSAGVDTKAFESYSPAQREEMIAAITRMTAQLLAISAPLVAAVNGHALGGGLVLTLCADYRLCAASGDPKFGLTEARAGVPFPAGPAAIIRHEVPAPLLRQLTLSSRTVTTETLVQHTLIDEMVPADQLDTLALERARDLASQPAFAIVKQQVRGALIQEVAALAHE